MNSKYQASERIKAENLIKSENPVFYGGKAGKYFMTKNRDFVLLDNLKNLYEPIRNEALNYFKWNKIAWWGGVSPTGHVLSSQIACLNHLFQIRSDKSAVLKILKNISNDFVDVFKISTDVKENIYENSLEDTQGYIQFEAVSDKDYLNEGQTTRGNNCTSVDALIYAKHKDGSKWLIPVEWKYTEFYNNQNKAIEGYQADPINCKGEVRKKRYTTLIKNSTQLINTDHSCYYYEPFYQLMRQTLWAEQMVKHQEVERTKAENFIHLHVIPSENMDLLKKNYKCSGLNMEETWRKHLVDQTRYKIISPTELLNGIDNVKYNGLLAYLKSRY